MNQQSLFDTDPEPVVDLPGFPCAWSPCKRYRYTLWRLLTTGVSPLKYALWVMLNPSTADESQDDPTIRRCIKFTQDWGLDALCVCNLFAFRATNPADMKASDDPTGEDNDYWLAKLSAGATVTVAAWGDHGTFQNRERAVRLILPDLHALSVNKGGQPGHPLYLKGDSKLLPYQI